MAATTETDGGATTVRNWDPLIRLTHWGIAAAVLLNGIVTEGGSEIHVWIGYAAFAFLALRLVWGFVGPQNARYSAFPPSLSAARAHVGAVVAGRHLAYRSHSPLGTLMVYALWATLAVVTVTGIAMAGSPFAAPEARASEPVVLASADDREEHGEEGGYAEQEGGGEEALEEIHEIAANLLLILAALHVAGVAVETRLSGRNLVKGMITGDRGGVRT